MIGSERIWVLALAAALSQARADDREPLPDVLPGLRGSTTPAAGAGGLEPGPAPQAGAAGARPAPALARVPAPAPAPLDPAPPTPPDPPAVAPARPASVPEEPGGLAAAMVPDLPLVRIVLPPGRDDPVEQRILVELPPPLLAFVGAEGIDWDPRPGAAGAELRSLGDDRTLRLRAAGQGPIEVEFTRPKIRPGQPGEVTIRVANPRRARADAGAGVFRGRLIVQLSHPKIHAGRVPVQVPIPIELVIPGFRLLGVEFLERQPGPSPLRVGEPGSVEVRLETVGGAAGSGTLDLQWQPEGAAVAERLLQVPLPLPVPIWDPRDAREGWACHPRWGQDPILAPEPIAEELARPSADTPLTLHRLKLILPDLFAPGLLRGRLTWSAGAEPSTRLDLAPVAVGSGIWARPRLAVLGETVRILAVVSRKECPDVDSWGEELAIDRSGPMIPSSPGTLRRREVAGTGLVFFEGQIQPGVAGVYRIAVARAAPASAARALAPPVEVRAPLSVVSRLPADEALVLFLGSPPFWWNLVGHKSEDGADHELRRGGALTLRPTGGILQETRVRLCGVFQDRDLLGLPGRPLDPAQDPRVRFAPAGQAAPAPEADPEWAVPDGGSLSVDLFADINVPPAGKAGHPRGTHPWLARWLLSGRDAHGQPVARLYQQPFSLRVATEWDYYLAPMSLLIVGLLLLLIVIVVGLIVLTIRGVFGAAEAAIPGTSPAPSGVRTGPDASDQDLLGGPSPGPAPMPAPTDYRGAPSKGTPAPAPRAAEAPPAPPPGRGGSLIDGPGGSQGGGPSLLG